MKKKLRLLGTVLLVAALAAGCAGASKEGKEDGAAGQADSGGSKGLELGIVLPTKNETRWLGDEAKFQEAIAEMGIEAEILFSQGSSATEKTNVETLISKGADIIVICPFDATAASAAVNDAKKEGITVISYDRLILDTDGLDYYVTFDSVSVGKAMGQYLVDQAKDTKDNNLYMYSGALTDNNSLMFFKGAWEVLQPKIQDGTFVVRNCPKAVELSGKQELTRDEYTSIMSTIDSEWNMEVCKSLAEANLTAGDVSAKGTCYVLGPADDDCCRALSDTFYADGEVEELIITGADGVEASVQYIIDGKQSMTVYKDPQALVTATMDIVKAVREGKEAPTNGVYNNNVMDVPSIQADVVTITRDNIVEKFFDSGVYDGSKFDNWQ